MTSQRCKGARDLLPSDTERFSRIENAFRNSCISWGYKEVKTPTLEYLHLFTAAGTLTPNMLSKVYSFLDWDGWSGERVVLRPDGTIPVARLYIENLAQQEMARLFYITNVFAFEETGSENREKWQCGVELLGGAKPTSDVEIILLAMEILRDLGIGNVEIQLSHAGLLKALLKELRLSSELETPLLTQLQDGNWQELTEMKLGNSDVNRLLSLLIDLRGKSSGFLENMRALPQISPALRPALDNFVQVARLLDVMECHYQVDITSTRGFEYYTGPCFQLLAKGERIGSGGRYDDLIPLIGGKNTPACGFALYMDPLLSMVNPDKGHETQQRITVRGESTSPEMAESCFKLAKALREARYIADLDFNGREVTNRWAVTIKGDPPHFVIADQVQKQEKHAASVDEIISIIGGSA